jgi:hypothetical protein
MNIIRKISLQDLGSGFIDQKYLPEGENEYYLRNKQNKSGITYRNLNSFEIEVLVRNRNTSINWNDILVAENFNPELVKNCKFFGLIRIGNLEAVCLEFNNLRMPVGLYNSTIINCDFGDNVVVDNVNYMAYYIVGNEVMLVNVNELVTTSHSKFGNGAIKEGEAEKTRVWMEVCNENGGRKILPFNGMLPGDAFLFSRYKSNVVLQEKFKQFTDNLNDTKRGYYGKIGDRTIIKNTKIIKDTWIGTDAYIKGANKIKNITINSSANQKSQVGEGCELVNGIVGYGCRLFYGVKAVRFVMSSQSQLKYGARLLNSYLGDNSTISCCEVLNALIFPSHEQHHNNSFLIASTILGQSNMAAGATIGSNHNSRSADGELIAGRGFWPGLCVSVKHNSKFASFNLIAKGDYNYELNNPYPFALISLNVATDVVSIMPAYWFMYNMYALSRNSWKYIVRDKRKEPVQYIDYSFLAPDSVNEVLEAMKLMQYAVGKAYSLKNNVAETDYTKIGKQLLDANNSVVNELEIVVDQIENSKRKVVLVKCLAAYNIYFEIIEFYAVQEILIASKNDDKLKTDYFLNAYNNSTLKTFSNIGGQLIDNEVVENFIKQVEYGEISSWNMIHAFYKEQSDAYQSQKLNHSLAALKMLFDNEPLTLPKLKQVINNAVNTKKWMTKGVEDSRMKDFTNPFRKMVYENNKEMYAILGNPKENEFLLHEIESLKQFQDNCNTFIKSWD